MRRCKDDWVNATQILKCCNFPKAKRTKILEKGVQQGLHEKIQGGYGRFQGTWIPLPDAQRLAASYGVTPDLAPVLYLNVNDPSIIIPKKSKPPTGAVAKDGTPIKRKYTKKIRPDGTPSKKPRSDALGAGLPPQDIFNTLDSYGQLSRSQSGITGSQQMSNQLLLAYLPPQQHQMPPTFAQAEFISMGSQGQNYTAHNPAVLSDFQNYQLQYQRLQQQQQQQLQQQKYYPNGGFPTMPDVQTATHFHQHKAPLSQSTNETTWSQDDRAKESDTSVSSTEDSAVNNTMQKGDLSHNADTTQSPKLGDENSYAAQLLRFFSSDNAPIPYFVHNPPFDFNINEAIDDEGHTPLHWASSIGNYIMIHLLISKGASPLVVNNFGLNPLSKLILFNNCFELKNFPKVLDDLELCLINTDINGRTPLHYLCQFAKVKSKYESLRYYLGIMLAKLSALSDQNTASKSVNLLKNVLDHQDVNGDTCLHLAARAGSSKLVKFLLSYGARDDLVNVTNETAKSIIVHYNLLGYEYGQTQTPTDQGQALQPLSQQQFLAPKRIQDQLLTTPIQSATANGSIETPDTQRTTIQEDDFEDDVVTDRVNKEQLESLMNGSGHDDNKENIFVDDSLKSYELLSTPKQQLHSNPNSHHQPLAVISERTVESTPIRSDDKKSFLISASVQTHNPQPPKLDEDGNIIEADLLETDPKLLMKDLSSMVGGMINSLSDSYTDEISKLNKEYKNIKKTIAEKEQLNNVYIERASGLLKKNSIVEFPSLEEGRNLLMATLNHFEQELSGTETALSSVTERNQAYRLANTILEGEQSISESDDQDSKGSDSDRWDLAIALSKLQNERVQLVGEYANRVKNHGIDAKMYKYRKLISLSCGLKVEDIDGLIDGIEESLMETSMA